MDDTVFSFEWMSNAAGMVTLGFNNDIAGQFPWCQQINPTIHVKANEEWTEIISSRNHSPDCGK